MPFKAKLLTTDLEYKNRPEILGAISRATSEKPERIATVNPEFILEAERNPLFATALKQMSSLIIDGFGLYFFLKLKYFRQRPKLELYHGSDLVEELFHIYYNGDKSFYLLGGPEGLAIEAKKIIETKFPKIRILGAEDGGVLNPNSITLADDLRLRLEQLKPDILLVGFGAPKQELWISAAQKLPIPVIIGVGGTFGFYSNKKRAPLWLRKLKLEWLFRGFTEKGHLKRLWQAVFVFSFKAVRDIMKYQLQDNSENTQP